MTVVGNFYFSIFLRLTWKFLGLESEHKNSVCWPNNKIIDGPTICGLCTFKSLCTLIYKCRAPLVQLLQAQTGPTQDVFSHFDFLAWKKTIFLSLIPCKRASDSLPAQLRKQTAEIWTWPPFNSTNPGQYYEPEFSATHLISSRLNLPQTYSTCTTR